ncbi:sensor domain-containing diguanylate cyclase [Paenibacillus cremeus]|uniref:Diguanylate cyclase n=1 Tax=Paenibacillus cremeus TaxID=2163881 RepID=A0A559K7H9_9BACL|nr:GGDEF domain-containing protein [Paenibacillus cremeus]TVY08074.1 diguanylate cyclase [Paenibacillus cremeus]
MKKVRSFSLRTYVIGIVLLSMIITLAVTIGTGYQVSKQILLSSKLKDNYSYAAKLAKAADMHLNTLQWRISLTSQLLADHLDDPDFINKTLENALLRNDGIINSILVADASGLVIAAPTQQGEIVGQQLRSEAARKALEEQKELISTPFQALTGRLVISISAPIVGRENRYSGFISGTIYLEESNVLSNLLEEHSFSDGSYVYVVDSAGNLLYHPDSSRIGEQVSSNPVVRAVMEGNNGFMRTTNTKGADMLAGYAALPSSRWGIIVQSPTEIVDPLVKQFIKNSLVYIIPFFFILLLLGWWLARVLSAPLLHLAKYAERLSRGDVDQPVPDLSIKYYEVSELHQAMLYAVRFLSKRVHDLKNEAQTDTLTGLLNRRSMNNWVQESMEKEMPFSIIIMDIDHFKKVNDTYGHQMGDAVLKFLAEFLQKEAGEDNICCRFGGEEFVMLLSQTDIYTAKTAAERLRRKLAHTICPTGGQITLSLGVAVYPDTAGDFPSLLAHADKALYRAKRNGRNCTVTAC